MVVDDGALDDAALVAQQVVVGDSSGVWARIESLRAEPGEALALIGPSGSGKTSLLRAFLGFAPFAGRVRVLGLEPSGARRTGRVLMLPQDAGGSLDPLVSIGRQLVELASIGRSPPDRREVLEALGAVGLPPAVLDAWPHTVSGGEARRVWIAVALLRRPDVLLVDEPEAGLDPRNRVRVADLLAGRVGEAAGCTVITTHDQAFARRVGARVVEVGGNSIDSDGAAVGGAASSTRPRPGIPGEARLVASDVGINLGGNTIVGSASLTVGAGEVVALTGWSGCGKTTLCRALAGLIPTQKGRVLRPVGRGAVQLLFQDAAGSLTPHRSVSELCREGGAAGFDLLATAERLGLGPELLERRSRNLSGGEQRRSALLRAMSAKPEVLILDEPTASLDRAHVVSALREARAAADEGAAVLVTTHEMQVVEQFADRVLEWTDVDRESSPVALP